ncbi:D-aminopeptidase [Pelotomaculum thermopropionicum SI]|uniref:D-aminopeptidase n=1 Tax=Pelotomaculum thermopropionicum (strain DSM 13744 / JCM 10971 / SI) TaxID=370438 RepID=A5D3J3_PELTS|nr:D-aminopeptidase [Pelotomaculum thermopropionicum SI]
MGSSFIVYIAADMEGTTGYTAWPERPPEDMWHREQMTAEVNAAIEGAMEAGATEIIVSDIHWTKQNIIPGRLLGKASLIRGTKRRLMWMDLVEGSQLVFLIGFHAGCGAGDAVLPHTMDTRLTRLSVNGFNADEAFISAVTAGYFGVAVGMASGDMAFIKGIRTVLPEIETVVVKKGIGNCAALNIHPAVSKEKIRSAAFRAVKRALKSEFKPYQIDQPVEAVMEFAWPGYADALSLVPGVRRLSAREVSFTGGWPEVMGVISLFVNWVGKTPFLS